MLENFNFEEKKYSPEEEKYQNFLNFIEALGEGKKIIEEINDVFKNTTNLKESERIIFGGYVYILRPALQKIQTTLDKWISVISDNGKDFKNIKEETRDDERNLYFQ